MKYPVDVSGNRERSKQVTNLGFRARDVVNLPHTFLCM